MTPEEPPIDIAIRPVEDASEDACPTCLQEQWGDLKAFRYKGEEVELYFLFCGCGLKIDLVGSISTPYRPIPCPVCDHMDLSHEGVRHTHLQPVAMPARRAIEL